MARRPDLSDEQDGRLRTEVSRLLTGRFAKNASALARELGVSQGAFSQFLLKKTGGSLRLLEAVAAASGRSRHWMLYGADDPEETAVVGGVDRYPNRARAARAARELGFPESVIRGVLSVSLKSGEDLPALQWFDWMQAREREQSYAARALTEEVTPKRPATKPIRTASQGPQKK